MPLIPFVILTDTDYQHFKLSYDVEVDLVDGQLPNVQELTEVASLLWSRKYQKTFVCFYLPEMAVDAGAFATAHSMHNKPQPTKINLWSLVGTEYESLTPSTNHK